ncbi:hypothetical protein [Cohnella silvisoli]|uniref:Phage protein n=1 Tax=Cohnella silvisoli TaxID=2873699 RepID=A0ABV1KYR8_9BACL|nr:hypothetical protein [Cohnella silvisoli]MCD9024339.1 hypothetical protein [Cohnella silvisoli]
MKKFPVTTEDGREFRVTIHCNNDDDSWFGRVAYVKLYVERKGRRIFRFKRIFHGSYDRDDGYDWKNPDFIALTAQVIADYDKAVIDEAELRVEVAKRDRDIAEAQAAFSEWDGRLSDGAR